MRRPFTKIEDSLEFIVERPFSMLFRRSVQPAEVGKRLKKELLSGGMVTVRGKIAPNDFLVLLDDTDFEPYREHADVLGDDLADWLEEVSLAHNLATMGAMRVRFQPDQSVRPGRFDIRATVREVDPARVHFEDPGLTEAFEIASRHEPGSRGYVEICSGPATGAVFQIRKQLITIGRDLSNDLVIDSPEVSRFHADIESIASGLLVTDRKSMNGTFLNGARITTPRIVESGDQIIFGTTICRYWRELL